MEEVITVSDIMVPLEEYATVSEEGTLYEAVMALERAQEELDRKRYHYLHRAILVFDKNNKIVGKISQLDVLKALEPKYQEMDDMRTLSRAGFSPQFLKSMMEQFNLCDKSFTEMCCRAARMKVKEFMYTPTEGEYVEEDATLCEAIHQLVMGQHQSLLVTRGGEIVGILRLTDVFKEIFQTMKRHCEEPGPG
ncbi:MAG: CBS domain-containing protein [Deltaproteobacteria bacterium]|nr:CBS domain-containing protein [Deltaproteobacteria bacterium]